MSVTEDANRVAPVEVKKRRLRGELRQARLAADMTQRTAADKLVWSISKIVRIEQGTVPVAPTDVRAMLQLYGVEDEALVDDLVQLAKDAREDKGWGEFSDILSPASLELFGNEPAAKVIYKYEPSVVPGLFQTEDYARSLLKALGYPDDQVERRLEVRIARQRLLESPIRPDLNFILGEAALIRPVGGEQVMRRQFAHVLELMDRQGITVWLLPFAAGAHRSMGSAFTILQFQDPLLRDLLYLENAERESVSRDEEGRIKRYLDIYNELQRMAAESGATGDQISKILTERFGRGDGLNG
jgi:transcriptional regulator with XRE-family HTH domain